MPSVNALYQELRGKGLEVRLVNFREDGALVRKTGSYFNAGAGYGVRGGLRRFKTGERFPRIEEGHFWKLLSTDEELARALPKRGHKA